MKQIFFHCHYFFVEAWCFFVFFSRNYSVEGEKRLHTEFSQLIDVLLDDDDNNDDVDDDDDDVDEDFLFLLQDNT